MHSESMDSMLCSWVFRSICDGDSINYRPSVVFTGGGRGGWGAFRLIVKGCKGGPLREDGCGIVAVGDFWQDSNSGRNSRGGFGMDVQSSGCRFNASNAWEAH